MPEKVRSWRRALALVVALGGLASAGGPLPVPRVAAAAAGLMAVSACNGGETQCRSFTGKCTGFGTRQCVTAPVSISPDATTIEQCCGGWFQYPWVEVCPGKEPRQGCGACLF
jgi:hypothetical protein